MLLSLNSPSVCLLHFLSTPDCFLLLLGTHCCLVLLLLQRTFVRLLLLLETHCLFILPLLLGTQGSTVIDRHTVETRLGTYSLSTIAIVIKMPFLSAVINTTIWNTLAGQNNSGLFDLSGDYLSAWILERQSLTYRRTIAIAILLMTPAIIVSVHKTKRFISPLTTIILVIPVLLPGSLLPLAIPEHFAALFSFTPLSLAPLVTISELTTIVEQETTDDQTFYGRKRVKSTSVIARVSLITGVIARVPLIGWVVAGIDRTTIFIHVTNADSALRITLIARISRLTDREFHLQFGDLVWSILGSDIDIAETGITTIRSPLNINNQFTGSRCVLA